MMLKALAIVVGIVVAATRLIGVISPEAIRRVIKMVLDRKRLALGMMVIVAILGGCFIYAFRHYVYDVGAGHYDLERATWAAWVLLAFGILVTAMAFTGLAAPNLAFSLASRLHVMQSSTFRLLAAVGVVVGVAIALLGWSLPNLP